MQVGFPACTYVEELMCKLLIPFLAIVNIITLAKDTKEKVGSKFSNILNSNFGSISSKFSVQKISDLAEKSKSPFVTHNLNTFAF